MSAAGPSLPTLYSSLWLCDDAGGVYVLKNLEKYVDGCITCLQHESYLNERNYLGEHASPPPPPPAPSLDWVSVGTEFSCIAAGFDGIVCGIRRSELYIRLGVSAVVPEGICWSKIICGAVQVAVGRDCIARKDREGRLFVANVRKEYDLCNSREQRLVLENWNGVSTNRLEELIIEQSGDDKTSTQFTLIKLEHFLLDHRDRLFVVLQSGAVYGCLAPCSSSEDVVSWTRVAKPPPVENRKPGLLQNLYWWFGPGKEKTKEGLFSQVCTGKSSFWCARSDNYNELWQLVVCDVATFNGVSKLKTNWSKVDLPTEDERAVLVAASKSMLDGIYTVMLKNSNGRRVIVAISLNQTSNGRVEIDLPSLHDPRTLVAALCSDHPSNSIRPQHHRSDSDLCCENGDCEFCQRAQPLHIPQANSLKIEREASVSILGKRPHPDTQLGKASPSTSGRAKRRQLDPRMLLIEGVEIQLNPWFPAHHSNNV